MSRILPADVPEILRSGGLRVGVVPDFGSNGHGPMRSVDGHLVHHTVGAGLRTVYVWPGRWGEVRPDVPSPRCNLWWPEHPDDPASGMGRDVWCVTAGLAYHAGNGSTAALADIRAGRMSARVPDAAARGLADDGAVGSAVLLGHEVENCGTAACPYPAAQLGRVAHGIRLLNDAAGLTPGHVGHHRQYTARKIDMSYHGDLWTLIATTTGADVALTDAEYDKIGAIIDSRLARVVGYLATGRGNALVNATYDIPASDRFPAAADAFSWFDDPDATSLADIFMQVATVVGQLDAARAILDRLSVAVGGVDTQALAAALAAELAARLAA